MNEIKKTGIYVVDRARELARDMLIELRSAEVKYGNDSVVTNMLRTGLATMVEICKELNIDLGFNPSDDD